ncbi:MAG: 50S ribosomal protein L11 methyltransferase [Synechococcaceae cyanobacterium]|nr:50S ribosomal protein L11 methyltransferase [Synechococcaceae cyanobacterium]
MPAAWWRLEMACPEELEDSLLWTLQSLGVGRVAVRHRPQAPGERQLLAWLPAGDGPADQRAEIERRLAPLGEPFGIQVPPVRWRRQEEEDWSRTWKRHWGPDPVGERLLILPAWLDPPARHAGRLVIRIDPGSAFGTGSHPSTRLCLEALEGRPPAGLRVADLGCGSGILSLAALRLGAREVAAADTDPLAVRATRENAALNGFPVLRVTGGSVDALAALLEGRPADVLLCNILAPVIERLCPGFERLLAPGGIGWLSGLLVDQVPALEGALAAAGWRAELVARKEPWGLLAIRRAGAGAVNVA